MRPLFYLVAVAAVLAVSTVDARSSGVVKNNEGIEQPEEEETPETTEGAPENPPTDPAPEKPTTEGPNPGNPPQEGDPCNPDICKLSGYCQSYLRCDRDSRKLVREECGHGLVWNHLNENGTDHIHGGNCDTWESLDRDTENRYRSDIDCLRCFWKAVDECSPNYLYQAPGLRHRTVLELSCSDGLIFSEEKETCQLCQDVLRADGSNCCGNAGNATTS